MRYFCHTHKPLPEHVRPWMTPISNRPGLGAGVRDLTAAHDHLVGKGDSFGEYSTLFALARELDQEAERAPEVIGLSGYRKFAVTKQVQGPWVDTYVAVTPEAFTELNDEIFLPDSGTLLMPGVFELPMSVMSQYARCHELRDLLYFMAVALDLGVVEAQLASDFLSGSTLVPCPAVGVFPTRWFVDTMKGLEAVTALFEESVAVEREGYQQRAVAFCLERLHSLLLLKLASEWREGPVISQRIALVSETATYVPG